MKINRNENGFALITALMITMICLVIVMGILSIVIQNTRTGGIKKSYQNAVEASYGGAELQMFEVMPKILAELFNTNSVGIPSITSSRTLAEAAFGANLFTRSDVTNACLIAKLSTASGSWPAACASNPADRTSLDPRIAPDFSLTLPSLQGQNYIVQSKIVDTSVGVPYIPAPDGGPMNGGGTGESGGSGTSPLVSHYVYRIEVSASGSSRPLERGTLSVLYEF